MKKFPFQSGDWFAVPLRDGGFALGVLARASARGNLFGYFFGPKRLAIPTLADVKDFTPLDAVLACRFGYLGFTEGTWPILGRDANWDPAAWPMPAFHRHEQLSGKSYLSTYSDDDPLRLVNQREVPFELADRAPSESLFGSGAVEIRLTRLLEN